MWLYLTAHLKKDVRNGKVCGNHLIQSSQLQMVKLRTGEEIYELVCGMRTHFSELPMWHSLDILHAVAPTPMSSRSNTLNIGGWICIYGQKWAIKDISSVLLLFCKVGFHFQQISEGKWMSVRMMMGWSVVKVGQVRDSVPSQWQWKEKNKYIKKHFRSRIGIISLPIKIESEEVRMLKVTLRSLIWATRWEVMSLIQTKQVWRGSWIY